MAYDMNTLKSKITTVSAENFLEHGSTETLQSRETTYIQRGNFNHNPPIVEGRPQPYRHVGKYRIRRDARDIVTGKCTFLDDFSVPRMIYAQVLHSPVAHAKIKSIDVSEAEAMEGVHAVVTHKDEIIQGWLMGWPLHKQLMEETVYYAGDPVAVVAADTVDIAREALHKIKVEYEELPAVFDAIEALEPDAPILFPGKFKSGTNEVDPGVPHFQPEGPWWHVEGGDVEQGFKESKYIGESMVEFNKMCSPCAPEAPCCIIRHEGGPDYTIWASSQSPFIYRLYNEPRIPKSRLRVKTFNVGGSYGNKQALSTTTLCAACAAMKSGRPVKLVNSKPEQICAYEQRLGSKIKAKIGMDENGIFNAVQGVWYVDTGVMCDAVQGQVGVGLGEAQLVMAKCKNWDLDSKVVVTNRCAAGIVRGYGGQELNSCLARNMAHCMMLADADPIETFQKNYVEPGDKYYWRDGLIWQSRGTGNYPHTMQMAAEKFGWKDNWKGWLKPSRVEGRIAYGVGAGVIGNADVCEDNTQCIVRIQADVKGRGGALIVQTDLTESGMGQRAAAAKFAAEVMNVPIERVYVTDPDGLANVVNFGLCGSRGTITVGKAVSKAAQDAKQKVLEMAALGWNVSPEQCETKDFQVYLRDRPEKHRPIKSLGPKDLNIVGYGQHIEQFDQPSVCLFLVEVGVDLDTGEVHVERFTQGTDIGQIIDNRMVRMQLQGGVGSASMDTATFEECIYDVNGTGRMLTTSQLEYKYRPFNDFPKHNCVIEESHPDTFQFKAIGIGEIAGAAGASAVLMAISNAIGVEVNEYPATPAVILKAIKSKEEK